MSDENWHGGTLGDRFRDAGHAERPDPSAKLQGGGHRHPAGRSCWARLALGVAAVGALVVVLAGCTPRDYYATPPTTSTPAAPSPTESAHEQALDKVVAGIANRPTLAKYSREQVRDLLDNVLCKHIDDIVGLTDAMHAKGVSAADAGYLEGANITADYC